MKKTFHKPFLVTLLFKLYKMMTKLQVPHGIELLRSLVLLGKNLSVLLNRLTLAKVCNSLTIYFYLYKYLLYVMTTYIKLLGCI